MTAFFRLDTRSAAGAVASRTSPSIGIDGGAAVLLRELEVPFLGRRASSGTFRDPPGSAIFVADSTAAVLGTGRAFAPGRRRA